jgi:hypothetical protein
LTLFDPERGRPIVAPPCAGPGCWAGAPGAYRDGRDTYLVYRMRRPQPGRGYELRIAASHDGLRYETVLSVSKERLDAESIERCALVRVGQIWRLYASFVRRRDRRWCIGLVEARAVDAFEPAEVAIVLDPVDLGLAAVKDPWLRRDRGRWLMFVSCGTLPAPQDTALHSTGDALSTGRTLSVSGIATSVDGRRWTWEGPTLWPSASGWDAFTTRLTTAVPDSDGWLGLYDGSASLAENYEERCGLARSHDLRSWERVSIDGPSIGTARGPGGVRYVDITAVGDVFYEYTRPDGAHELRVAHTG